MRLSLSWITALLGRPLGVSVPELQARLSTHVAEIEHEILRTGPNLDKVVIGKVLTCAQHPNADRLRVTTVDVGAGAPLPIVCGAPNVAVGQTVAVATVGATLTMPDKDGTPTTITIKAGKLRGEPSHGMICAEDELGLGAGHDGILVLPDHHVAGTPLAEALGLGDTVFVIENHALTHRPDLWGQHGWAREVATVLGLPAPAPLTIAWQNEGSGHAVAIRDEGCLAYAGAVVEGVSDGPSPQWLVDRLAALGTRSLGRLVDVTNYVMHELGQPMHAFDLRDVGPGLCVRAAAAGEPFTTLDGKAHTLVVGDLLIADDRRPLALAGIMGGQNSAVRSDTTAVLLEAATFRPERVRKTRLRLGLSTDSATRFEKGLPVELAPAAIHRAIALLVELCPGARVTHRFHDGRLAAEPRAIAWDRAELTRLTGLDLPAERCASILATLGVEVTGGTARLPWWRAKDLNVAADLVEEIARHHGYHHLTPEVPRLPAAVPAANLGRRAEHKARAALAAQGWDEVSTYAFASDAWATACGWSNVIRLANPLSSEQTVLRGSLLPGLVEAVARNRRHLDRVAIYEVGKRYGRGIGTGWSAEETGMVAGACAGLGDDAPFYAARDAALAVLADLGYDAGYRAAAEVGPEWTAGRTVELLVQGKVVGLAGEVPKALRTLANAPERVGWFQIGLEALVAARGEPKPIGHTHPSRFQAVTRDFTWICPEALPFGDLASATRQAAGALGREVRLVSIYRGKPYDAGQKAVSLQVVLQADDRTLEEGEMNALHGKIVTAVTKRTPATLRAEA